MPRPTKFFAGLRDLVRREVGDAMQTMLNLAGATTKRTKQRKKATNGRGRKRRGPGRPQKDAG